MRSCIPNGLFFLVNGKAQEVLDCNPENNSNGKLAVKKIIAGGLGGQTYWFVCYPFDVIKSHMQNYSRFSSVRITVRHIVKEHGYGYFYKGVGIALVRAFPVNAINFCAYEYLSKNVSL